MAYIDWKEEYATGIKVIDGQHKRIVHYMNQLDDARKQGQDGAVKEVLDNLVDYTLSHFAFEESLMEDAGYPSAVVHAQTHESFRVMIREYQADFAKGVDVTNKLLELLGVWLIEHIAQDDNSYVPFVRNRFPELGVAADAGWLKQKIRKFFH